MDSKLLPFSAHFPYEYQMMMMMMSMMMAYDKNAADDGACDDLIKVFVCFYLK